MSRRTRNLWAGAITTACVAVALILLPALLRGYDARQAASHDPLVVHEWGTFTSFSGSNGVNLEFRPLVTRDLPRFVVTPDLILAKPNTVALQRMETPVTYFYTKVPRVVQVCVDFPQGSLTDWYPDARPVDARKQRFRFDGRSYLDWGAVRLTPPNKFADIRLRDPKGQVVSASLPQVEPHDHYGQARETDSAYVEVIDSRGSSQFEKFLFYRGLGNFNLPVALRALGGDRFEVLNEGRDATGALLLVRIKDDRVRFARSDAVGPRTTIEIELPSAESTVEQLAEAMAAELIAAGLYEKEAWAMVNTWRSSWFGEDGTRLLYLVPERLTDELLPLTIEPVPDEQVRVLVGRLETMTPEDCQQLVERLTGGAGAEPPSADVIKAEVASLGRFAEPAIQFAIGQTRDAQVRGRLEAILAPIRARK